MILLGPLADRFHASPRLQRILQRVHACGVRPTAELLIELLEAANADPSVLDRLEQGGWPELDPNVVRAIGGDRFAPPPLHVVPRRERGK